MTRSLAREASLPGKLKKPLDLSSTLRQVRAPIIHIECQACGRSANFSSADVVKKHGASVTLARLRRIAAMGCERVMTPDGDRCETRFPCLQEPGTKPRSLDGHRRARRLHRINNSQTPS